MSAYAGMWLSYCKQNNLWFAVCGNGAIDQVTDCGRDETVEPDGKHQFGSKVAYEWLVRWHSNLKIEKGKT